MNENAADEAMDAMGDAYGSTQQRGRGMANQLFLAGLGAMALSMDTLDDTFDRLVNRGEEAQLELREQANAARSRRRMGRGRMSDAFRSGMDAFLDALSVPNKADVDTINVKLNILSRKLDDLQMSGAGVAGGGAAGQPDIGGTVSGNGNEDPDLAT